MGSSNAEFSSNLSSGFSSSLDQSRTLRTKYVHYASDFPQGFRPNVVELGRVESSKEWDDGMSFHWRRKVGAVKSKRTGGEWGRVTTNKEPEKMMENDSHLSDGGEREKVLKVLGLFRRKCASISRKEFRRVDCRAMKELENEGKITKGLPPRVGDVPGVKVGDKFEYRIELVIIGLHRLYENGIDHMWKGDKIIATCIVATEGHFDKLYNPNVLTYVGEGGRLRCSKTGLIRDQKLKSGNLALWNSMEDKNTVRVVKGFKKDVYDRVRNCMVQRIRYVYDGLYHVTDCERKKGLLGNSIFEFKLLRCPGQPTVSLKEYRKRT